MKSLITAAMMVATTTVCAEDLTIERLVASPSLSGPSVQGLKMSPDGKRITFLQGKESRSSQLDLWQYNIESGESVLLVDSNLFMEGEEETLSEEEKARRERNRALTGKSGILSYFWSDDSKSLLFPIGGDVYVMPLEGEPKQLTNSPEYETDIKFSPQSRYVSFIRNRELFAVEIASGKETQLTNGATETIANGMAEFVVQEELSRSTGYWWSPDERKVAFEQFDESEVLVKDRYEIQPDGSVISHQQRYPAAGTANVEVRLGILNVMDRHVSWVDLGDDKDIYLARVGWSDNAKSLIYQTLNRTQTQSDVVEVNPETGEEKSRRVETSKIWVNVPSVQSSMRILGDAVGTKLYTSEATGYRHIYREETTGEAEAVTGGDWVVSNIERIDEKNRIIYFTGHKDGPTERHLYAVSFDGGKITKITQESGWHSVTVGDGVFIDHFSSPSQPPQIMVRDLDDGSTKFAIVENGLGESHPYAPYTATSAHHEFGTVKATDGTDLHYRLILPPKMEMGKRYPAIMAPYGGPHGQSVRQSWDLGFNEILARNGYVVMVLDNRGMWNRGLKFEGHIKNAMGTVEIEDQVSGAQYLKSLEYVDPGKIGIWGWSYGGYMTLMGLFKEPDLFKAGASVAPVTDWRLYDTAYTERYLGHPDAEGDVYENSSVFKYVDGFSGKLLLVHGMADDNVFFDNSVKLMSVLQNSGKPFELMTYPGKKHGIRGSATRAHLYQQILSFFDRNLK